MKVVSLDAEGQMMFVDQTRPMTIEDLLLHKAGLAYGIFGGNPIEEAWKAADLFNPQSSTADMMDRLTDLPLVGQPGQQWSYSYSIDVLGRIAEILTGQILSEAM